MTRTWSDSNCCATASVRSVEPSSTTIISFGSQVWAIAERSVSDIHSSALYAGMRIDIKVFMIFSPTSLHTQYESTRQLQAKNDARWRNPLVPDSGPPNSYKDRLRNMSQSHWLILSDRRTCKEIQCCLPEFLHGMSLHRSPPPADRSYRPERARHSGIFPYREGPVRLRL